jgi:hypothetical protein
LPTTVPSGITLPSVGGGTSTSSTSTSAPPPTLTSTTSATVAGTTTESSSSGVSYWWFVAAAVLVALLAIILAVARHRRRSGQDWTSQVQRVGALGATVHDVVSATTTTLVEPLAPDRALAIDQRINDLDVELHGLEAAAPDESTALRIRAAVAALGSLRSAVDILVSVPPGDALIRSTGVVDARLADFDAALRGVTTTQG